MKQRGFTILEVAIAITIAAMIMAAAMPSATAWIRSTRIRTVAESMSVGLQQARAEAVRRNQTIGFYLVGDVNAPQLTDSCALSANSSGWVAGPVSPAAGCVKGRDAFVALRAPSIAGGGLAVAAVNAAAAAATTVTFNGYGQVVDPLPITCIRISNSQDATARALNIAVNSGGQVRMCDPAVTSSSDPRKCEATCS
jgi:type IV fimbrial biogenesis protein FimT